MGGYIEALSLLLIPSNLIIMLLGVMLGLLIGMLPGLGGSIALALLIPVTFGMPAETAIILLISTYGAVTLGGSLSAILVNTPGTAQNAATAFDGFPLTQKGKAGYAIGAAMTASALGGAVGLLVLVFAIPIARNIILAFSYPEFFMLALFGLTVIAVVTKGNTFRGLIAAGFGLMLAFIGTDPSRGQARFTFETNYLWDGINLITVIIGMFALAEAMKLFTEKKSIAEVKEEVVSKFRGVISGVGAVFKHWWLFLRCSIIGIIVGIIPGVGGTVAGFMSYGHAVQSSKHPEKFGHGAIEGIIASEAANDSKEGGSLLPTFAFGIPGSAAMAILLGGLVIHGIAPGPSILTEHIHILYILIVANFVGHFIASIIGGVIGAQLVFLTRLRGSLLAPVIVIIALVGAYTLRYNILDVVAAIIFGLIGYLMDRYGYSKVAVIIALVLGRLIEANYHRTIVSMGLEGFLRPISLTLLILIVVTLIFPTIQASIRRRNNSSDTDLKL